MNHVQQHKDLRENVVAAIIEHLKKNNAQVVRLKDNYIYVEGLDQDDQLYDKLGHNGVWISDRWGEDFQLNWSEIPTEMLVALEEDLLNGKFIVEEDYDSEFDY